jgi:hypothetical protein
MNDSDLVARTSGSYQFGKQAVNDTCGDVGVDQDEVATNDVTHLDDVTDALLAFQFRKDAGKFRDGHVELEGEHYPPIVCYQAHGGFDVGSAVLGAEISPLPFSWVPMMTNPSARGNNGPFAPRPCAPACRQLACRLRSLTPTAGQAGRSG